MPARLISFPPLRGVRAGEVSPSYGDGGVIAHVHTPGPSACLHLMSLISLLNENIAVVDLPWLENDPTHLDRARATPGRVMLAGGLGPGNVRAAIDAVHPWAVDSARSTESEPGVKDHEKVREWVEATR